MNWERYFVRVQAAGLAVLLLCAAAWGPRTLINFVLNAGPPNTGELVPRQLVYRGYLERDGIVVDQPGGLEFALTLSPSDGGAGLRTVVNVPVSRGNFSIELGDDGGIPASLLDDPGTFLTVQVQPSTGGPVLSGSQRLLSVAFSQRAAIAWNARQSDLAINANDSLRASRAARSDRVIVSNPDGGAQSSFHGILCGITATTNGQFPTQAGGATGIRASKLMCEQQCATPTAHMCTFDEIRRSFEIGISTPIGWVSASYGTTPVSSGATVVYQSDCYGWTTPVKSGTYQNLGSVWCGGQAACGFVGPTSDWCDQTYPVLCCN